MYVNYFNQYLKKCFFKTYGMPYCRQRLFGRGCIVPCTVVKELKVSNIKKKSLLSFSEKNGEISFHSYYLIITVWYVSLLFCLISAAA